MQLFGQPHIHLGVTDSTNSHAMRLLSEGELAEGTVISAGFQSAGRGQAGNSWSSFANENLLFSLILKPSFLEVRSQFDLSKMISLGVQAYLTSRLSKPDTISDVRIKWPNDLMVGEKKIAGILIENIVSGSKIRYCVAGVGLNLNSAPEGACFLGQLTEKTETPQTELGSLLAHMEACYLQWRAGADLHARYLQGLWKRNETMRFSSGDSPFEGVIRDVNASGQLVMDTGGIQKAFNFREIRYLR